MADTLTSLYAAYLSAERTTGRSKETLTAHDAFTKGIAEAQAKVDRWDWCVEHPHLAFEMVKLLTGKRNAKARFAGMVDSRVAKAKGR